MAKKKVEEKSEEKAVENFVDEVGKKEKPNLGHISVEFGREDLNQLRDKVNELVDHFNAT